MTMEMHVNAKLTKMVPKCDPHSHIPICVLDKHGITDVLLSQVTTLRVGAQLQDGA